MYSFREEIRVTNWLANHTKAILIFRGIHFFRSKIFWFVLSQVIIFRKKRNMMALHACV